RHVVVNGRVMSDQRSTIDDDVASKTAVRGDDHPDAEHRAVADRARGRHAGAGMLDAGEPEPGRRRLLDEGFSMGGAEAADRVVRRGKRRRLVNPDDRPAEEGLLRFFAIPVLDEGRDVIPSRFLRQVGDFRHEEAGAQDDQPDLVRRLVAHAVATNQDGEYYSFEMPTDVPRPTSSRSFATIDRRPVNVAQQWSSMGLRSLRVDTPADFTPSPPEAPAPVPHLPAATPTSFLSRPLIRTDFLSKPRFRLDLL